MRDMISSFPHTLIVIMFKKRTNAKAYAAAKKEFKASASKASTIKADTETGSFHKDPTPPGDSTKTNPAFLDYNTTANQQSDQEFPVSFEAQLIFFFLRNYPMNFVRKTRIPSKVWILSFCRVTHIDRII